MASTKLIDELGAQLESARRLMASKDWAMWVKFLKYERKGFLQDKINAAVREGNIVEAQKAMALFDDCNKQIALFGGFVNTTESKLRGESDGKGK